MKKDKEPRKNKDPKKSILRLVFPFAITPANKPATEPTINSGLLDEGTFKGLTTPYTPDKYSKALKKAENEIRKYHNN